MLKNIKANFIAQFVLIISTFYSLPQLLQILGSDAYALIGLYFSIQGVFMLVDLGLGAGIIKVCSSNISSSNELNYKLSRYLNTSEIAYVIISFISLLLLLFFKQYIISDWKKTNFIIDLDFCYMLMSLSICLRLMANQYRSVFSGFERQVLVSVLNGVVNFFRYIVVIFYLLYFSRSVEQYFIYQLLISVLELLIFIFLFKREYKPSHSSSYISTISFSAIKELLRFSSKVAVLSFIWIILLQFDKFILTRIINMNKFAYYSMASTLSLGLIYINSPLNAAILPRLSSIFSSANYQKFKETYFLYSKFIMLTLIPITILLVLLPNHMLYCWTGDNELVKYAFVTRYYSLFLFSLLLIGIPFIHSFATNNLKINVKWNLFFVLTIVPLFSVLTNKKSLDFSLQIIALYAFFFSLVFVGFYNYWYFKSISWLWKIFVQPILLFIPGVVFICFFNFNVETRMLSVGFVFVSYLAILLPYILLFRDKLIDDIKLFN